MFNEMAKWSITEKPKSVGPTWFRLRSLPREPFHLFVSLDEAQEIADFLWSKIGERISETHRDMKRSTN